MKQMDLKGIQFVDNSIKVILATLFFICLLDMPYGYYQLVRFVALLGFVLLSYHSYKEERFEVAIIFGCLGLLFQPFIKVSLGRQLWNIVDVVVGLGLIISIVIERRRGV